MKPVTVKDIRECDSGIRPVSRLLASMEYWPELISCLVNGPDSVLVVDAEWLIEEANESFLHQVNADWRKKGRCFLDTLTLESREKLKGLIGQGGLEGSTVELRHALPAGTLSMLYQCRSHGDQWVLVGRERSEPIEPAGRLTARAGEMEPASGPVQEASREQSLLVEKDPVTGIPGRKAFERAVDSAWQRCAQDGTSFAVILLDIDNFRNLNDLYGHPTGDLILQQVARILEENLREGDLVARIGDDEFAMSAAGLDRDMIAEVAERLRMAVELARMPEGVRGVTVSAGVSMGVGCPETPGRDPVSRAERALAQAKKQGRNCVSFPE